SCGRRHQYCVDPGSAEELTGRRGIEGGTVMSDYLYPPSSPETSERRRALSPETERTFQEFSKQVFAEGVLSAKMKQVIAVAVAHVTQCPYCIRGHTKAALRHGATQEELMEAIRVSAEVAMEST